jgi:8-oxo-dGTP diphosphatase
MSKGLPPRVGVAVIVVKSGKVLLGRRKGAHGEGTWAFPGGHLAFGEAIETCACREVMEETGLTISDLKVGPFTNDVFAEEKKHYVTIYVAARYAQGRLAIREPDKCEHWDWFYWHHLPRPRFLSLENLLRLRFDPIAYLNNPE